MRSTHQHSHCNLQAGPTNSTLALFTIARLLNEDGISPGTGNATYLKHTVDHRISTLERKQKTESLTVSSLKTKVMIEGDEIRQTLRSLGQEIYTSIDQMEDRVDEVSHTDVQCLFPVCVCIQLLVVHHAVSLSDVMTKSPLAALTHDVCRYAARQR